MRRKQGIWDRYERHAYKHFGEAATRYLREFTGKDKRRQALALESTFPYIGEMPLIDVNDGALEQYKEDRLQGRGPFSKPAMAGTVNKELTVVSTVLNRACRDWQWIPSTPRIRRVRGAVRTGYPLTWDEQERLFSCLPSGWDVGLALFAVNTGVRKGELYNLKWSDRVMIPELETYVFILRDTKNGQDRAVICNSIARRAVGYQEKNGSRYVFPSRRRDGPITYTGKVWTQAWLDAGLPSDPLVRKGIHNLRHTFGHRLRAAGVPDEDRAALLGHNNVSLVQHYAMPDIERLSEMAERVTVRRDTVVLRAVKSAA